MQINHKSFLKLTLFALAFTYLTNVFSQTGLPDFTTVVEKNIPAVVIVNATKTVQAGFNNSPFNSPDIPDELRYYFGKFFDPKNGNNKNQIADYNQVISYE